MPEGQQYPEFGQCVHKIVQHTSKPERLFLQNHWGLYRSDDSGDSEQSFAEAVLRSARRDLESLNRKLCV